MADIPVVVTAAGAQPTSPAALRTALLTLVASTNPGYTANLPGSLIEDVSSTEVGGLSLIDGARVETINSLDPLGANDFLLSQLGQIYIGPGSAPAVPTNTSVSVIFNGPVGLVIAVGVTVSDGTYQYVVQDGGIIESDGFSAQLFCQATTSGSWAVPSNTVTNVVTSYPTGITVTCTNPEAGVSGAAMETSEQYRARVLQAGQAVATGTASLLKTLLGEVEGVQARLVSIRQQTAAWEVIVGGGDPYAVAYAIYNSGLNIATLEGSTLSVTAITQANPGKVTTDLNHGFTSGQTGVEMTGIVGMTPLNGVSLTVTVVNEKEFTVGINTSGYPAYVSGGVVTPNFRNVSPSIYDYPDIYTIPFVSPPQQTVTIAVVWNTTATNFVSVAAVAQLAAPALADYVNSIAVGGAMSVLVLESTFLAAVSSVLEASQVSSLSFAVSINGISTDPEMGTSLIFGDPESYFSTSTAGIAVTQG